MSQSSKATAAAAALAGLPARLTTRDYALIDTLGRFGVMTSAQIAAVFFPGIRTAYLRLRTLTGLGILARTRLPGTGAHRYTLDWAGQAIWALRTGAKPPTRPTASWEVQRRFLSPTRAHDEGAVEAVAALHLACRHHGGTRISEWLTETEASAEFTALRPDAAFTLETDDEWKLRAWYEHDTGTETIDRLEAKITAYTRRRSPLLAYNRTLLIGVTAPTRARTLAERVAGTADLTVAIGPCPALPPASRRDENTATLLTERSWTLLGSTVTERSLLDLAH